MNRNFSAWWGGLQRLFARARALDVRARLVRISRAGRDAALPFSRRLGDAFLDVVAPGSCRECGRPVEAGRDAFCGACSTGVAWIGGACPRCGTPLVRPPPPSAGAPAGCGACARLRLHFDLAAAGARYEGPIRTAVLRFKFEGDRGVLPLLRSALDRAARSEAARDAVLAAGAIVPVPLHPWKRFLRGRDPARELAEAFAADLARERKVEVARLLRKVRWTPSQVTLHEAARRRNLRAAFRVRRGAAVPSTVILVDDVLTTCTTASRSALALKRGGAERVIVLAVARS
jgi:predicted amidophosphoribosyltransferase